MFNCTACLWHAIKSIAHEQPAVASIYRSSFFLPTRNHATLRSLKKGHHRKLLVEALETGELVKGNRARKPGRMKPTDKRDAIARVNNRGHLDVDPEKRALERMAAFEAQFLGDPLRLAQSVLDKLREDEIEAALALVRASEKRLVDEDGSRKKGVIDNVVSWNHIMDWMMSKGETAGSLKIYNEMKKRGHRPDSKTYTILLRGLARYPRKPNTARDAVRLYNSIYSPNSTVTPNTIHVNAALNVCARAGDMDSIWGLAGRLPERGAGSPDRLTYTTILNALQNDARLKAAKAITAETPMADTQKIFDEAVGDGRKLWMDVIRRWQKADLLIDEPLVCAMGRLLLTSGRKSDANDVFELVGQTMNVRVSDSDLDRNFGPQEDDQADTLVDDELDQTSTRYPPIGQISMTDFSGPTDTIYATPSNNTLSMLIEASTVTKNMKAGKVAWDLLTSTTGLYKVVPDKQNFTAYFRLLRLSRASKAILDVLSHPWPQATAEQLSNRGLFVLAMSTCIRDKNNHNVFETATKILEIMQNTTGYDIQDAKIGQQLEIEPKVLTMYMNLAITTAKGMRRGLPLKKKPNGDYDVERDLELNNVTRALHKLEPDIKEVKRLIKLKVEVREFQSIPVRERVNMRKRKDFVDVEKVGEKFADLVGFLRGIIGAYDRIIAVNDRLIGEEFESFDQDYVRRCLVQKRRLTAFLGKMDAETIKPESQNKETGLWEGYDANSVETDISQSDQRMIDEDVNDEDFEDIDEDAENDHLSRHSGRDKLQQLVRTQVRRKKEIEATRRLSRRQIRERESERRIMKIRSQYPASSLKPRRTDTLLQEQFKEQANHDGLI